MCGEFIPRLYDVRRVPVRYHQALPLSVARRHQCVVLGASRRTLTVGITTCNSDALLIYLQVLTGATLFPVMVEPERMRLLIARVERNRRFHYLYNQTSYALLLASHARLLLAFKKEPGGMEKK